MNKAFKFVLTTLIIAFIVGGIPTLAVWYFDLSEALNVPYSIWYFWLDVSMYLFVFLMIASIVFKQIPLNFKYYV